MWKNIIIMLCIDMLMSMPSMEHIAGPVSAVIPGAVEVAMFMRDVVLVPFAMAISVIVEEAMLMPNMSMLNGPLLLVDPGAMGGPPGLDACSNEISKACGLSKTIETHGHSASTNLPPTPTR